MAFFDTDFFSAMFVANIGRDRGFSEEQVTEAFEKLNTALGKLEERLKDRDYLADEFSLANIAQAGAFVGLRELEERGEISLDEYPNVTTWIRRLESRESYMASA